MSKPATFQPHKPSAAKHERQDAYQELDALVVMMHRHGILRLAHDVAGSLSDIGLILARAVESEGGRRGASNLYLMMQVLARIDPERFERVAQAMGEGLERMGHPPGEDDPYPPGITGLNRLLHDDDLWTALGPALEGVKAFAARLQQPQRESDDGSD